MDEKRLTIPAADGTVHVFEKGNVTWFEVHEGADPSYPGQPAVALIRHALQQQAHIDAQAERIKTLEKQLSAKILMGVGKVATVADARARQETATAIMREVTATSIDRWVLDSPPEKRWLLESTALDICRTHGAILEDPDGQ